MTDWDMKSDLNTLIIKQATKADSGEYRATAKNMTGENSVTVTVKVVKEMPKPQKKDVTKTAITETLEERSTKMESVIDLSTESRAFAEETVVIAEKSSPQFITQPQAVTEPMGGGITIQCQVSGSNSHVSLECWR